MYAQEKKKLKIKEERRETNKESPSRRNYCM